MTKILIFMNSDLLSLGIISYIRSKVKGASLQREHTWGQLQTALIHDYFDLLIVDSDSSDLSHVITLDSLRCKQPSLKTIILGEEVNKSVMLAYLKKGVEGVCMKSISRHRFFQAYKSIMEGQKYID